MLKPTDLWYINYEIMKSSAAQLSTELQELYLENKNTLSEILFLENESMFFQKLLNKVITSPIKDLIFKDIKFVNLGLTEFQNRRAQLKSLIGSQQHSVEIILKDTNMKIDLSLVNQNATITSEIRALLAISKRLKKELYTLVECVIANQSR